MFKAMRCQKCGHVMAGEDDFIQRYMEKYNQNVNEIKHTRDVQYKRALVSENAMLRDYLKQILHWQNEVNVRQNLHIFQLKVLKDYIKENQLMPEQKMYEILDSARDQQNKALEKYSAHLQELYGEFENICTNHSKPDPTANAAIGSVMKKGKKK